MISLLTAENYAYVSHVPLALVYFRAHAGSFSIVNSSNQVSEGYTSAIGYYLSQKCRKEDLIRYLARSWFREMRRRRSFINPKRYLLANEGSGSLAEITMMISSLLGYVIMKIDQLRGA